MKRLVLIDGSSYLYRAFHALPPLTNAEGNPTGALFGVVNMLRATLKENPDYVAFVVDAPGRTFRDDLDAEYKANRPPMPDDLRPQVQPMCDIVHALGIDIIRIEGVEADDVIGTLAVQAADAGIDVTISTSDKDFAQLVRSAHDGNGAPRAGIALVNTMSGSRLDNDASVIEKFGVRADQIIDYLALMGDKVDNIPGVDKCGPKTAAKWLAEYGSLAGVIDNADSIKGKIGENLRAVIDRLPLNRTLTTIKLDVDVGRTPTELVLRGQHVEDLRGLYARYGFKQALRDIEGDAGGGPGDAASGTGSVRNTAAGYARTSAAATDAIDPELAAPGEYECVDTREQLDAWIVRLQEANEFAFDTETDALDAMRANLVGLSFAVEPGRACYIPVGHDYPGAPAQLPCAEVLDALRPLLTDPALRYLGYETTKFVDVAGKGAKQITFNQVAVDDAVNYAAEDADITLRLHRVLSAKLAAEPALEKVYREIEMPLVPVLERIEANGVLIDADELRRQSADLGRRMLDAQQKATALAGRTFNLDSPKQVCALLFDELKLPALVKTPKGQPSANEEALEAIADQHELPRIILDYRSLAKLRGTYTDKLPQMINADTGRLHTSYHQAGAATGRLSSSDPNLQNIPIRTVDGRHIRTAFIAPPGRRIVACDYSQIELRIMAHLSGDEGLLRAFAAGADIHKATAAEVFGKSMEEVGSDERRAAKAINFGLMYGMSAFGLAKQLGVSRGDAQDYIGLYFARYPGVREFMDRTREQAREQGYVETVFGRRLYLDNIQSRNQGLRAGAERAAINAPMQGTAADIIKRAMIDIHGWLADHAERALMILQVHDELVFEVDTDFVDPLLEQVVARMVGAADLRVPLLVESGVGANWDEAH